MKFTYTPNALELFQAMATATRTRFPARERWLQLTITIGAMVLVGAGAGIGGAMLERAYPAVPALLPTMALFIFAAFIYVRLVKPWMLRRSAAVVETSFAGQTITFEEDEAGLVWSGRDFDIRLRWTGIETLFATRKGLGFGTGLIALYLPFSAFETEAQIGELVRRALDRMPPEAKARSLKGKTLGRWLEGTARAS